MGMSQLLRSGEEYADPGAVAADGDGDEIFYNVKYSSALNVNSQGKYEATYTAIDPYGNLVTANRDLEVRSPALLMGIETLNLR